MEFVPSVSPTTDAILFDYKILILVAVCSGILVLIISVSYMSKCAIKEKETHSDGINSDFFS